ncbi:C45 family autoproteolytic acyltransferase/hydolase [Brevibacillus reuszeri]|uniref:C45 family autoproteolytic acyltransferase/hydolase n=1 Tax=Brevibacillus reuszeri TaxID=54915 RepID=UPI000CCC454B|nr:C45 family peptidase [Brevibacillus reuszeri]
MSDQLKENYEGKSSKAFPFFRFRGTHRQIGQQFGESCTSLIKKHLYYSQERLNRRFPLSTRKLEEAVLQYRPYVQKYAASFDEEVIGISEGAGITVEEAYLLQLRAEINHYFKSQNECTTFAVLEEATSNGIPLIGQNCDLPAFYSELGVVVEIVPDHGPATLMLTTAGQISYIGINNIGMGVFANFLTCDGWRVGFPRYMFSRLALTTSTVEDAIQLVRSIHRASSRNLIMMDKKGAADLENTPTREIIIRPENGLLAHSNHYTAAELLKEERLHGVELENSRIRLDLMQRLLKENHGKLNVDVMQDILRDRSTYPHCLCQIPGDETVQSPGDNGADIITFASVIAEPTKGNLWVAIGPPNQYEYKRYSFSESTDGIVGGRSFHEKFQHG